MVPELCDGPLEEVHRQTHGHPPRLRERDAKRRGRARRPLRSGSRRAHPHQPGREGAPRRRRRKGRVHAGHEGADGRVAPPRSGGGQRGHQRKRQPHLAASCPRHQEVLRQHSLENSRTRRERVRAEVQGGELHHQVREVLHPHRRRRRGAARRRARAHHLGLVDVDLPRALLPRRVLPLRARHLHSPLLLCGDRRGVPLRHPHQGLQLPREVQQRQYLRVR